MKNLAKLLSVSTLVLLSAGYITAENVRIHGSIKNLNMNKAEFTWTGMTSEIYNEKNIQVVADDQGNFDLNVDVREPGYYKIAGNIVYIKPGDNIETNLFRHVSQTTFKGGSLELNEYLKKRVSLQIPAKERITANRDFPQSRQVIDSMASLRIKELDNSGIKDKNIYNLELARIKASIISENLVYFNYGKFSQWNEADSIKRVKKLKFYTSIKDCIQPMLNDITADPAYLEIPEVREVVFECFDYNCFFFSNSGIIGGLVSAKRESEKMDKGITKDNIKELSAFVGKITNIPLRTTFKNKLDFRTRFMEGRPAVDFEMKDVNGQIHKLSEYKGKVIYIDFWATWCLPCMAQSPTFKLLSEKYQNICFVAVSVDQDFAKWKKKVESEPEKSVSNYNTDVLLISKAWDLASIPRFLLIDKDFTIINAFAPRPSEKENVENLLNSFN